MLHQEIVLDINADVAEFCPVAGHHNLLAVGTYQLDEASQTRHGRLHLYSLAANSAELVLSATRDLPGIFDLQWLQLSSATDDDRLCIGLALADGRVQLLSVAAAAVAAAGEEDATATLAKGPTEQFHSHVLKEISSCQAVREGMALSLDWNVQQQQQQASPLAAVSSSSGSISVLQAGPTGLTQLLEWKGHDLEAWMASWDKHQANVLYSGADDCTFKAWDIRCPSTAAAASDSSNTSSSSSSSSEAAPIFSNCRAHAAGVCCISSHPRRPSVLVTGSYDEAARLWDVRRLQQPLETCQVSTGGGVWRLKWHPQDDRLLLAACMYNGFALLQLDEAWGQLQVVEEYKGHESIAYGADWYKGSLAPAAEQPAADAVNNSTASQQQLVSQVALGLSEQLAGLEVASQCQHQQQQQQHSQQQPPNNSQQQPGAKPPPQQVAEQQQQPVVQQYRDLVATCSFYDRRLHLWSPRHVSCCCSSGGCNTT